MTPTRKHAAVLLAALAGAAAAAFSSGAHSQEQNLRISTRTAPTINPNMVVLDPAHGGTENGATLGDKVLEKDITLVVMAKVRNALQAAGFTVISTREADNPDPPNTDQRAEIANRAHPAACIVIHATATGSGVHIYTSTLSPTTDADTESFIPIPWDTAQGAYVTQSQSLASGLNSAFGSNHLPALTGQASVRPLDNLMCPAVAIEMAPLPAPGVGSTAASDASYQQQVAAALTAGLRSWRNSLQAEAAQSAAVAPANPQAKAVAAAQAVTHAAARTPPANADAQPAKGTQ